MNKRNFLKELKKELRRLKASEIQKHLSYYEEMISDMTEHNMTEAEAVARIGSPKDAAREILESASAGDLRSKNTAGIVLTAASAVLIAVSLYLTWKTSSPNAAVSIIGGADGPTSIFIAGRISRPVLLYAATAGVLMATILYYIRRRCRK